MISINNQVKTKQAKDPVLNLKQPSEAHVLVKKVLSNLTSTVCNNLPSSLKLSNSPNSYTHRVKKHFFKKQKNKIFLLNDATSAISNYKFVIKDKFCD